MSAIKRACKHVDEIDPWVLISSTFNEHLFHTKSEISTIGLDLFKEIILSNPDIFFTILSGNHDLSAISTNIQKSATSVFTGYYKNVKCFPLNHGELTKDIYIVPFWIRRFSFLDQL